MKHVLPLVLVCLAVAGVARAEALVSTLPAVRLTPPGAAADRVDLGGVWGFVRDVPEGFDGTAASVPAWEELEVPGHFALAGFGRMHEGLGVPVAYTRRFTVAAGWAGDRVRLRLDGVDGLTRVWINGEPAGESDLAKLPAELDVTGLLRFGETNELTLTVEKSLFTWWAQRELGGIMRPVSLLRVPAVSLAGLRVSARPAPADGAAPGVVEATVRVANDGEDPSGPLAVRFALETAAGEAVPLREDGEAFPLAEVPASGLLEVPVRLHAAAAVEAWTAESPAVFRLRCELLRGADEKPAPWAERRFGFRTVEAAGNRLLVNGTPVTLRGANFHVTAPGYGHAVPPAQIRSDVTLMREANLNALRVWPTPAAAYAEACDELGVYTTIEAPMNLMIYAAGPLGDHGADPSVAEPYRRALATMLEAYGSHPSVIAWGLANECPWHRYFQVAAAAVTAADPTRPVFFGSDRREGVGLPGVALDDDHYPRADAAMTEAGVDPPHAVLDPDAVDPDAPGPIGSPAWGYPLDRPTLFTEWLHVHTNNWKELAADPGVDAFWGLAAEAHAAHLFATDGVAGGFLFKGLPYRGIEATMGAEPLRWRAIVDEDRRRNDLFWHVKKSHSPLRVLTGGGGGSYPVINRFDFKRLDELAWAWEAGGRSGTAEAEGPPRSTGSVRVPAGVGKPVTLIASMPDGREIDRWVVPR